MKHHLPLRGGMYQMQANKQTLIRALMVLGGGEGIFGMIEVVQWQAARFDPCPWVGIHPLNSNVSDTRESALRHFSLW